jgi:hypothetical protein
MIKRHKFYFFFYNLYLNLIGIKPGTLVKKFSEEKKKYIQGKIISVEGVSITKNKFGFDFRINWDEPIYGNDNRFFTVGWYQLKDLNKKIFKI